MESQAGVGATTVNVQLNYPLTAWSITTGQTFNQRKTSKPMPWPVAINQQAQALTP